MPFAESVKSPCYDMYRHYLWHIGCEKALTLGQEALPLVKQVLLLAAKERKGNTFGQKGHASGKKIQSLSCARPCL